MKERKLDAKQVEGFCICMYKVCEKPLRMTTVRAKSPKSLRKTFAKCIVPHPSSISHHSLWFWPVHYPNQCAKKI